MGSDGLFDNLYDKDITDCLKPLIHSSILKDPEQAATCIA